MAPSETNIDDATIAMTMPDGMGCNIVLCFRIDESLRDRMEDYENELPVNEAALRDVLRDANDVVSLSKTMILKSYYSCLCL